MPIRIFLSPPDVGATERDLLLDAFDSNWIAPLGPHVNAFEQELAAYVGVKHAVALASGTAAIHLALLDLGVKPGDSVLTSTLTFAATANAITYVGAQPIFVDVSPDTWQMDPGLLDVEVARLTNANTPPAAVITVDLYGQVADHDPIRATCAPLGIPIIEDAAEALGATYHGSATGNLDTEATHPDTGATRPDTGATPHDRPAGSLGDVGILSFNGNKIITTSGGGALLTDDGDRADRIRYLATQARDPAPHYEHSRVGFNYRLSNLLAAVGRGQLQHLDDKVARRRQINAAYRHALADLPGIDFLPNAPYGQPNNWLTCITIDPDRFGVDREHVRTTLVDLGIEARPVWKPMHLQPVFADARTVGGEVAAQLFADGLCLPSGSSLTPDEQDEIVEVVRACHR